MNWFVAAALLVLAAAGAGGLYVWVSNAGFEAHIAALRSKLVADRANGLPERNTLPAIVLAYAERAGGRAGTTGTIRATQTATLTTSKTRPAIPVKAEQWTSLDMPGIVWRASGTMMGLPFTVLDAYVAGAGEFSVRLLGTFPVGGGTGADYDKGELMRYLSELPIYPDAILNNRSLSWRSIDPTTVEVTAVSKSGSASVRFNFDSGGDIVSLTALDRPMTQDDGTTRPTPWVGTFDKYQQFGRYRLPAYGEVGWGLADGLFTYWHGTLISYEPAP